MRHAEPQEVPIFREVSSDNSWTKYKDFNGTLIKNQAKALFTMKDTNEIASIKNPDSIKRMQYCLFKGSKAQKDEFGIM
jgi:hypothetical protein